MGNNNEEVILDKIFEIAQKIDKENGHMTRSDLAYELKDWGIKHDSSEISRLVWSSWKKNGEPKTIERAFVINAGNQSLIETYKTPASIDDKNINMAIKIAQEELKESNTALEMLSDAVSGALEGFEKRTGMSVSGMLTGAGGIEKILKKADISFLKYTQMVNSYEAARCNVQEAVSVFIEIRNDIALQYRKYALALIDIFGDSIKSTSPELFDFEKIEWLDVQGMQKQIELKYTTVTSRCSNVMSEISDSFQKTLDSSIGTYKAIDNKKIGLICAGINLINHYLSASTKTAELAAELKILQSDMRRDATQIGADSMRLVKIYKTLNEVHTPKAELFYKYGEKILNEELDNLLSALYSSDDSKKYKAERERVLNEMRLLERKINDATANITYFKDNIKEVNSLLSSLRPKYEEAISSRPSKPLFIINLITLGNAKEKFNRDFFEWNATSGVLVKKYEDLKIDVKLDNEDLVVHQEELECAELEYKDLQKKLKRINDMLIKTVDSNIDIKKKMLSHLKDIVKLISLGKSIAEAKIEAKDLNVIQIKNEESLALKPSVEENIDKMSELIRTQFSNTEQNADIQQSKEALVNNAVNAFNSWSKLAALNLNDTELKKQYNQQLNKLKEEFTKSMAEIDDKSAFVRSVAIKLNTANSSESIKNGLYELANGNLKWGDLDWNEFIKGSQKISI